MVQNGQSRTDLLIENDVPILRAREVMSLDDATSPCRRIYFAIQLMYVDPDRITDHQRLYWDLVREVLDASPSMTARVTAINARISDGHYYPALKLGRKLIAYEEELIGHAQSSR